MGRNAGSGSGSVYKRGDKWRGQITVNGVRRSFTAKKKSEVLDWIAEIRTSNDPTFFKSDMTVEDLAEIWLDVKSKQVSQQTMMKIESTFNRHLIPILGKYKLKDLDKMTIERAYPFMYDPAIYTDQTVNMFRSRFKSMLEYAVDHDMIKSNPHDRVAIPKYNRMQKIEAYDAEDHKKIINYLKTKYDPPLALFYVLLSTGMREGEAAALTWDDVDLEKGVVIICKTVVTIRGTKKIQHHPKTAAGVRTIHLSRNTLAYLRKYKKIHGNTEYLFLTTRGGWFDSARLGHHWTRVCAELNIERKRVHALRHTFATRALEKGVDVKIVSAMLGHKNVVTTMNVYQDVFDQQKKTAAEIMNDLF